MSKARLRRTAKIFRLSLAMFAVFGPLLSLACSSGPDTPPGAIHVLTANDEVGPVMERYLDRGIGQAEDQEAGAVVIRLDTPGGLISSMNDIIKRILDSDVPVVVYVWPSGGQAASAGTYITYASHVAAMAPGTVIGSATPISGNGDDIGDDLRNKLIGNSVSKIRELARLRDRNADWGEEAVRDGISANAGEAIDLNIVEYIADDLQDLLQQIDGAEGALDNGQAFTLHTEGVAVEYNNTNFIEDILGILADPNIAFLLLSLGSLALFIEIIHPGGIFPGTFGVISLLLGFFALSVLPFNWAGVTLIMFAFILFGLEMFVVSHGILGIGGAVALVLGGLLLTSDNPPGFQVSPWLVFSLAAALAAFVVFVVVNMVRIRRMPARVGADTVVGRTAVARSALNPSGFVMLDGEHWQAEAEDGEVQAGEQVVITEISGL